MDREQSLLAEIDPYKQALKALHGVEPFGIVSGEATKLLTDLSDAFRKGVADAVRRLHQQYYRKNKMPQHLFTVMKDVYGEGGWF